MRGFIASNHFIIWHHSSCRMLSSQTKLTVIVSLNPIGLRLKTWNKAVTSSLINMECNYDTEIPPFIIHTFSNIETAHFKCSGDWMCSTNSSPVVPIISHFNLFLPVCGSHLKKNFCFQPNSIGPAWLAALSIFLLFCQKDSWAMTSTRINHVWRFLPR